MGDAPATPYATWEALGLDPETVSLRPDGTVRVRPKDPPDLNTVDASSPSASDPLQLDPSRLPVRQTAEVEIGPVIGEGGMGRVWIARQRSLERDVAVKGIRAELDGERTRAQLLREALVTGALEHPSIVPVHALVRDPKTGTPLLVMKRVEGVSWGDQLEETRGEDDFLETHLRILMQVCHVVHFAHRRGVLHRDIKPDNVMLGEFGEIYVLDWGIALALHDGVGIPGLPLAKDAVGVVGTLQYMPPEMVLGDGRNLDERSDVYLLGATLHEILTGQPRHNGEEVTTLVAQAWQSLPPTFDDAPEELADLCTRATHEDRNERPPSAEAFRQELESYLLHRSSTLLAEEATRRAERGRAALAAGDDPLPALRESRFAFQQALRIWPANPAATRGLAEVVSLLFRRAIEDRALDTAQTLLAEMSEEDRPAHAPDLERLEAETLARERRFAALAAEVQEADLGQAARQRRAYGVAFGVLFWVVSAIADQLDRAGYLSHVTYVLLTATVPFLLGMPALMLHRDLFPNRVSRRLAWSVSLLLLGQVLTFLTLGELGVPMRASLAASLLPLATAVTVGSTLADPPMAATGIFAGVCAVIGFAWPETAFYSVAFSYSSFFVAGALRTYRRELASDPLSVDRADGARQRTTTTGARGSRK